MLIPALLIGTLGQSPLLVAPKDNDVVVEARADRDGVHAHMEGFVDAPLEQVAEVIADVERYPSWLPIFGNVRAARAFALAPLFDTEWRLPWPLGTLRQRMRFERLPADNGVSFLFEQRSGEMKRHDGYWLLTRSGTRTHVIYDANVAFQTWVPSFLVASFERAELPKLLAKLEAEAKRRRNVGNT